MKLTEPKIADLRELLSQADDASDHHMLWVSTDGNVHLDPLGELTAVGLSAKQDDMAFRLETFMAGNGYLGGEAAKDDEWVSRLFRALIANWRDGTRGYVDVF